MTGARLHHVGLVVPGIAAVAQRSACQLHDACGGVRWPADLLDAEPGTAAGRVAGARANAVTEGRCKFAFVLEQTFGQVAHTRNLEQALSTASWIDGTVVKLPFDPARRLGHIPGLRNWSLRA